MISLKLNQIYHWFISRKKKRFYYFKDRLFLLCVIIYILNRFIAKPLTAGKIEFFSSYVNDLICFPFWLPIVFYLTRLIRLRWHDGPPNHFELLFYFLVWSYMFEVIGPAFGSFYNYPVADPWDVVCYAAGTVVAGLYWNFEFFKSTPEKI